MASRKKKVRYRRRSSRHRRSRRHRGGRRRGKKRRTRRRIRKVRRWRGGAGRINFGITGTYPPVPAFPPGGPYQPASVTNGLGKGFYYSKNNKVVDPPINISARAMPGGRRRKKYRRATKRRRRARNTRRRRARGGGSSTLVNSLPGGSNARDVWWAVKSGARNLWNTWNGQPKNMSSSPSVQPIGRAGLVEFGAQPSLPAIFQDSSRQAAKFK